MTTIVPISTDLSAPASDVYLPQADSHLLIETLRKTTTVTGRSVLDLCTGTGVVAIAAARLGAHSVTAWDICPRAVSHTRRNATSAGVTIDVRLGSWTRARKRGPFDLVLANPPYVPADPESITALDGPTWAWDAGPDGRLVLDPLCAAAPELLAPGGTLLFVQSEFTNIGQSLEALSSGGLFADVVARQRIPFGPVLTERAEWLERTGKLAPGIRFEDLVVIRADRL